MIVNNMDLEKITNILGKAIQDKIFPCCVVGVVKTTGEREIIARGNFTYESNSKPVTENSVFDIASVTKSIPTGNLILKLIGAGKISSNEKVIDYIPELNNSYRKEVLIKHLLTYTFILDLKERLASNKDKSPDEILKVIFNTELKVKPGTQFLYTNAPSILLGLIAERVYGKPLDKIAEECFFSPLGMTNTTFRPNIVNKEDVVPTEQDEWRGRLVHGEVHDETAFVLRQKFVAGNAGLFSTVPDLLTFLEMLLNRGEYEGKRYFSEKTVSLMQINQLEDIGESASFGWELNQPRFMGKFAEAHTFGKTGFTGCLIVCDIPKGVAFTILSNTIHPKRRKDATLINQVRCDIADIILSLNL